MYGLVNKAVKGLVISNFGEEKWEKIKSEVGFEDNDFVSMQAYPDSLTYDLVVAASDELGLSTEYILKAFGEYWILFTAEEGYGETLRNYGNDLITFLKNLDRLHEQVAIMMPELTPPSFTVNEIHSNKVKVIYESQRDGLSAMVIGLLTGLGKKFNKQCTVEHTGDRAELGRDEFIVTWE